MPGREKHVSVSAISTPSGSLNGAGAARTLPLPVRETVYTANTKLRKWIALRGIKHGIYLGVNEPVGWLENLKTERLTESLDVQGELIRVLDQVIDLAAVRGDGTLGLAALCTRDDEVRHVERVLLEWCMELG